MLIFVLEHMCRSWMNEYNIRIKVNKERESEKKNEKK
jgi:hypothetical protein